MTLSLERFLKFVSLNGVDADMRARGLSRKGTRTVIAAMRIRVEGGLRGLLSSGEVYEEDDTAGRFCPFLPDVAFLPEKST